MKISLEWLTSFTPGPLDAQNCAQALTQGGLNVESVEGDILDVEVTSNRGDCLCHLGVAREVAALMGRALNEPPLGQVAHAEQTAVKVHIESLKLCPHYTGRVIRGVKIGPSPSTIARRLQAVGLRPINNVVDITNYVLMEMGQPLHAFDLAKIGGGQIVVRPARGGEKLLTLDGREQVLADSMLVIADNQRPMALAGIMGGVESAVHEGTTDILLESARFDPLCVRKTSRALALRTDSSYRFERGIDPTLPVRASARAAQLIQEVAGGSVSVLVAAGEAGYQPKTLSLRLGQLHRLLGVSWPAEKVVDALSRLGLKPALQHETIAVQAPSWRLDLNIEADLIEEAARVIGYDQIPLRQGISIRLQPPDTAGKVLELLRDTMIAAGYFESITFSFVSDSLHQHFFPPGTHALRADPAVRKADGTLRPSLLPGLLESVRRNQTVGVADARLFEIGSAFLATDAGKPDERRKLAFVGAADWRELRGVAEALLHKLDGQKRIQFVAESRAGFAEGACAAVDWAGNRIGFAGQIAAGVASKLSLGESPLACELDLTALLDGYVEIPPPLALAQYPAARRDLSLVVDESLAFQRIEEALAGSSPANLEAIEYVTTFRGKPLEAGKKSVTVTLVFRSDKGTLSGEEVEASVGKAFGAAAEKLAATLRQ